MLILITGTPGAGKSLYSVWEYARKVPGSTIENGGQAVPRRLLSNIKDLVVEHDHIGPQDLETWHEWAKPGDVILFDEVQEVWRPRSLGAKVPDCIAALETHRHKGVDIILVTQHPMLVDPNIRRLVNQHLHLRRITKGSAWVYEWDHCANPGQVRTAIQSRLWWHPKRAYSLYKSAQLHTKPTTRLPRLAFVGVAAVAAMLYMVPTTFAQLSGRFKPSEAAAAKPAEKGAVVAAKPAQAASAPAALPSPAAAASPPAGSVPVERGRAEVAGCINVRDRCKCVEGGMLVVAPLEQCRAELGGPAPLAANGFPEWVPDAKAEPVTQVLADADALAFMRQLRERR